MNRHETDEFETGATHRIWQLDFAEWYPLAGLVLISEYFLLGLLRG